MVQKSGEPVEVGSLFQSFTGPLFIPGGAGFRPSTVAPEIGLPERKLAFPTIRFQVLC